MTLINRFMCFFITFLSTFATVLAYSVVEQLNYIDFNPEVKYTIIAIAFNPIFWNIVGRLEYYTHFLTKITGSRFRGCYIFAFTIFTLGIFRDYIYHQALIKQPTFQPFVDFFIFKILAITLFAFGNVLVLSSMYSLGIMGTYLGDYFGILKNERLTGFPFNINDNPMYNGSTLCFLGIALWYGKPTGIVLSLFVFAMYRIALLFEEPFTHKIYSEREKTKSKVN